MADKMKTVLKHVGKSLSTGEKLDPPEFLVDGQDTIQLPSAEEQRSGFSLSTEAETLRVARLFPTLFKTFLVKDGSPVIIATDENSGEEDENNEE